ncbi:MAG: alpha/beta hydrolase-fold protein [Ginsengibacter sp.]
MIWHNRNLFYEIYFTIFERYMPLEEFSETIIDSHIIPSRFLKRDVVIDFYFPPDMPKGQELDLLLINDGQDLVRMNFPGILNELYSRNSISPLLCVGIHCGDDRKNEYGTANITDYKGRGAKASLYTRFVFEELLPFIRSEYSIPSFHEKSFCGFSLGGLCAFDIVWNHAEEFSKVGAFSGSFWWRTLSQDDKGFDEREHRIMHNEVRLGTYHPWLKFFFETGTMDETADRNHNGVIDSIDDTLSLIEELEKKGYDPKTTIRYMELKDGKHDVPTWGRAFPDFLKWGWGK